MHRSKKPLCVGSDCTVAHPFLVMHRVNTESRLTRWSRHPALATASFLGKDPQLDELQKRFQQPILLRFMANGCHCQRWYGEDEKKCTNKMRKKAEKMVIKKIKPIWLWVLTQRSWHIFNITTWKYLAAEDYRSVSSDTIICQHNWQKIHIIY